MRATQPLTPTEIDNLKRAANEGRESPAFYKGDWQFPASAHSARAMLRSRGWTVTENESTGYVSFEPPPPEPDPEPGEPTPDDLAAAERVKAWGQKRAAQRDAEIKAERDKKKQDALDRLKDFVEGRTISHALFDLDGHFPEDINGMFLYFDNNTAALIKNGSGWCEGQEMDVEFIDDVERAEAAPTGFGSLKQMLEGFE